MFLLWGVDQGMLKDCFLVTLDDVKKFERAVVSGKPFESESAKRRVARKNDDSAEEPNDGSDAERETASDREPPQVVRYNFWSSTASRSNPNQNNARRSIMAFLQDQSSDNE